VILQEMDADELKNWFAASYSMQIGIEFRPTTLEFFCKILCVFPSLRLRFYIVLPFQSTQKFQIRRLIFLIGEAGNIREGN
jgi:hypothetical protein